MSLAIVAAVVVAGSVAGCLGSLLGIGGGVFLVPFLNAGLGLDFKVAMAISLMTVIATSSVGVGRHRRTQPDQPAARHAARGRVHARRPRWPASRSSDSRITRSSLLFAIVTASIAIIMLSRLERRNVLDAATDPGTLGRAIPRRGERPRRRLSGEAAAARAVRVARGRRRLRLARHRRRDPQGAGPERLVRRADARRRRDERADDRRDRGRRRCRLQYARGYINPPLAAAAVLGVLLGSRAGFWFGGRARVKWLKLLMALVLAAVSAALFHEGAPMSGTTTPLDRLEDQLGTPAARRA